MPQQTTMQLPTHVQLIAHPTFKLRCVITADAPPLNLDRRSAESIAHIDSIFSATKASRERLVYALAGLCFAASAPLPFGGGRKTAPGFASFTGRSPSALLDWIIKGTYRTHWDLKNKVAIKFVCEQINRVVVLQTLGGRKDELDELMLKGMKKAGHCEWFGAHYIPDKYRHVEESVAIEIPLPIKESLSLPLPSTYFTTKRKHILQENGPENQMLLTVPNGVSMRLERLERIKRNNTESPMSTNSDDTLFSNGSTNGGSSVNGHSVNGNGKAGGYSPSGSSTGGGGGRSSSVSTSVRSNSVNGRSVNGHHHYSRSNASTNRTARSNSITGTSIGHGHHHHHHHSRFTFSSEMRENDKSGKGSGEDDSESNGSSGADGSSGGDGSNNESSDNSVNASSGTRNSSNRSD
ncbi:hypothetical protein BCR33DRAFT_727023 [Rhizoclosmatium globosum]|uniref:Uncharacterized protein n=1 Tax=Rhizoclosmatium globosum TaxID=329046 RepID=A0A1Y2AS45_9FUNG|nr:hypothetical protein BCR33DRAFT_727023 [Rhizoclosmatium globosum]|eukprot:ORY25381.1 hypothetical protein BCR33DRAFT_727023 [Rhizoclosmatium globosum]